jgi:hypothetical protein
MTRAEREDILRVARAREKVAKTEAKRRSAVLLSDVEDKLSAVFHYDENAVWARAHALADAAVKQAQKQVVEECQKLGIPARFAPSLHLDWYGRGENMSRTRRAEVREAAKARIAAIERDALASIEAASVRFQTEVLAGGMTDQARALLAAMPTPEALMPPLGAADIAKLGGFSQAEVARLLSAPRKGQVVPLKAVPTETEEGITENE